MPGCSTCVELPRIWAIYQGAMVGSTADGVRALDVDFGVLLVGDLRG